MLKRLLNRFEVELDLVAIDPLAIGTSVASRKSDSAVARTHRGDRPAPEPFVPGSSLKGVLRGHAEAMARALRPTSICMPHEQSTGAATESCGTWLRSGLLKPIRELKGRDTSELAPLYDASCPACRLFGSLEWKGRTEVSDAYPTAETRTEVRDGVGIDRISGGAASGAKFDVEVVPAVTTFETRLGAHNFEAWMVGWLAFVLRDLADGRISVGGKTSRGMGRIKARLRSLTIGELGFGRDGAASVRGLGTLLGDNEREAYGAVVGDVILPDGVTLQRPPGSVWAEATVTGHDDVRRALAALSRAWPDYATGVEPLSARRSRVAASALAAAGGDA